MRVALITGAGGGIGSACCLALSKAGFRLVVGDLTAASLEAVQQQCVSEIVAVAGDLTEPDAAGDLVDSGLSRFGRLDAVVNCAGASHVAGFPDQGDRDWQAIMSVNLDAAFRINRAAAKAMIAGGKGGAIVNVSSIAYKSGGANPAYGAAKAGLVALTYSMAQVLGPHGITVNAVAPGIIDTDMVRNAFPGAAFDKLEKAVVPRTPMRRLGRPEDIAAMVAFLVSGDAGFVTGAVLPVTGGLELLPPIGSFIEDAS